MGASSAACMTFCALRRPTSRSRSATPIWALLSGTACGLRRGAAVARCTFWRPTPLSIRPACRFACPARLARKSPWWKARTVRYPLMAAAFGTTSTHTPCTCTASTPSRTDTLNVWRIWRGEHRRDRTAQTISRLASSRSVFADETFRDGPAVSTASALPHRAYSRARYKAAHRLCPRESPTHVAGRPSPP